MACHKGKGEDRLPLHHDREDWETWSMAELQEWTRCVADLQRGKKKKFVAGVVGSDSAQRLPPPQTLLKHW
jgi:hypothetical protein